MNAQGHCCNPTHAANVTPPATSIAIATVGAHNGSDMAGFQAQYPYLAYHFQEFGIDGTPACCDDEGTLDLEWSTAMANSFGSFVDTAMVYMYDGANAHARHVHRHLERHALGRSRPHDVQQLGLRRVVLLRRRAR